MTRTTRHSHPSNPVPVRRYTVEEVETGIRQAEMIAYLEELQRTDPVAYAKIEKKARRLRNLRIALSAK